MSEEVYFNEPGFEGEAGTDEGEAKNEAYSNIVRYCNINFAMIDMIKSPPQGFKEIVERHFFLKRDEIIQECRKWLQYAEKRNASYVGLVNDHNSSWCSEFKKSKTKYKDMLTESIKELERLLYSMVPPSLKETSSRK